MRARNRDLPARRSRLVLEALEPRLLASADLPGGLPVPLPEGGADSVRHELVFVDSNLAGLRPLLDAMVAADRTRALEVIELDATRDGIDQMDAALAGKTDIDAVHVLTHGQSGAIQLGDTLLTTEEAARRAAVLGRWHQVLSPGADLLLYGCDVAGNVDGIRLMETLGALTGADVAASDDLTGAVGSGGDWALEQTLGVVSTRTFAFDGDLAWRGTLSHMAEDPFATSGNLDGDNGGSGWADAWSADNSKLKANGSGLDDPDGLMLTSGASVKGKLNSAFATTMATRNLSTAVGADGTTTWIGYLMKPGATSVLGDYLGLEFGSTASDVGFAGYFGSSFIVGESGSVLGVVAASGATASAGQTYFIALKIEFAAGNDTITMYVDPTPGALTPDSAVTAVKSDIDLGTFTRIGISHGRALSANPAELDELRVGDNYLDIAPSLLVTTTADTNLSGIVDGNLTHTIGWLDSHRGTAVSLREALIAANNTTGTNSISFDIDAALVGGKHTITLASALPTLTDAVILDGTTEPDYAGTPVVVIDGSAVSGTPTGLALTAAGNTVQGIEIRSFGGAGISVSSAASAAILGNLIHGTGGQAIDLGANGTVLANDAGDADGGASNGMNHPVIYAASVSGGTVTITGEGRPGAVVQFFEADTNATDHGGASSFIGSGTVGSTGTAGTADSTAIQFSFSFSAGTLAVGDELTATATASSTTTSEFAANVVATEPNVAPVLDNTKSPVLSSIAEDAGAPSGAVGTLVSQLVDFATPSGQVDNVSDSNASASLGIAVTAADTTNGTWWYTTNAGTNWFALGSPGAGTSRLLAADANTRLCFQPGADYTGTIAAAITFRAWDRTTGSNGGTADTTTSGGTTAFSTATDTASLAVTAVNDAPTLSAISDRTIAEDGTTGALAITVADVDSTVASLTVTATSSNTTLVPNANLVAGGSGSSRTLTVTPAADANGGPVTITVTVSDGSASSSTTFALTVTAVNDAPVNTAPATATGHEDAPLVFSSAANTLAIVDVDAASSAVQVTLSASNGSVLTLDGTSGLTFGTGDGTADASLSFTGTVADINAALDGMQLLPASGYSGPTFLTITTVDQGATGSGGALNDVDTIAITIASNDVPTVTLPGTPSTYTEGGAGVVVDASLTASDSDDPTFASAVLQISSNYRSDQDRLEFSDQLGITGTWNSSAGTLTLTGTASVADYRTALRTVTYRNTSDAPSESVRTIAVSVNDGAGNSPAVTTTVNVAAVNDPPAMTVPTSQSTLEDTALVFSSAFGNAITIADPDAGMDGAQITLTVTGGTLTLASTSGIAFGSGANGTSSMAIAGTVADLNAALDGLVFQPAADASGSVTLQAVAYDFGNYGTGGPFSDTESVTITVTSVNDAPVGTDRTLTTPEDTPVVFSLAHFAITDASDSPANTLAGVVITAIPAAGSFTLSGSAVSAGQFITAASLSSGALQFTPAAGANGAAYAVFSFRVRDDGGTADGGVDTDPTARTITLDVTAANDAPTVTGHTAAETYTEDTPRDLTDIVVADADGGTIEVILTLSDAAAGTLNTGTSGSTTSTFTAGIWRANGAIAEVNALLATLGFTPAANYASGFTIDVSVGDGVAALVTGTKTITAVAVNDDPTITAVADQTVAEDTPTGALAFTIGDAETSASALLVTVTSSDTTRVASTGLALGGSGASRTLTITPVPDASGGPVTITISVLDGTSTVSESFDLTITTSDDPMALGTPTLSYVRNATTALTTANLPIVDSDGPAGPVSYTVRNVSGGNFENNAAPGTPITTFTASDLAAGSVRFVHTGGDTPPAFEVSATDGATTTAYVAAVVTRVPSAADIDTLNTMASNTVVTTLVTTLPDTNSTPPAAPPSAAAPEPEPEATAPRTVLEMAVPRTPATRPARATARSEVSAEEAGAADQNTPPRPVVPGSTANLSNEGAPASPTPSPPSPGSTGPTTAPLISGGVAPGVIGGSGQDLRAEQVDAAALAMHAAVLENASLREALDQVRNSDDALARAERLMSGSSAAVAGSLSVGYVVWLLRGGVLLSGLLSSLPAWQVVDPLPVLSRQRRDDDDEEGDAMNDPLERLFSRTQALARFGRHRDRTPAPDTGESVHDDAPPKALPSTDETPS